MVNLHSPTPAPRSIPSAARSSCSSLSAYMPCHVASSIASCDRSSCGRPSTAGGWLLGQSPPPASRGSAVALLGTACLRLACWPWRRTFDVVLLVPEVFGREVVEAEVVGFADEAAAAAAHSGTRREVSVLPVDINTVSLLLCFPCL